MKKLLIKWLMPKPAAIAEMAAEVIAKTINESNKTELIAKYDSYAVKLTELQTFIVKLLDWILEHIYVRTTDLQAKPDEISPDEVKPKTACEIGIKIRW